jgi:hypothetical protein
MGDRALRGLCVDDRMEGRTAPVQNEPLTRRQRTNKTLRWLGLILPLVITYPIVLPFISWLGPEQWGLAGFQATIGFGAALWIGFTVALAWRRDWTGAAAISAFYLIVDAWWWLLALEVIHFD